jgi:hypothetical protein
LAKRLCAAIHTSAAGAALASLVVSISAAQADAFYAESIEAGEVWAVRDGSGFPAPETPDGSRTMPFWSKRSRAERVVTTVAAYAGFEVVPIPLDAFRERWLPGLRGDGLLVGLNWSGKNATGYDLEPASVEASFAARG